MTEKDMESNEEEEDDTTTTTRINSLHRIPTNLELVQRRLALARAKAQSRKKTLQEIRQRNLDFKNDMMQANNTLLAIKVSVCEELRKTMNLSSREKRGRIFLSNHSQALHSLTALNQELHRFFRSLKKGSFVLKAGYPTIQDDGSIQFHNQPLEENKNFSQFWDIATDEDVIQTFQAAQEFYQNNQDRIKRPVITIQVQKDPNAPERPSRPFYLNDMADPSQSTSITMLSFYAFPPGGIDNPEEFSQILRKTWKPFQALGRVYVAHEGINAQMSVPTNVLNNFVDSCRSIPQLANNMENGINIDPIPIPLNPAPFTNLHIRARHQVVADGLDKALNWQSAGYDMPPMEWHQALKKRALSLENDNDDDDDNNNNTPLLLDCRNIYETDVGIFDGAEPLGTNNFRDTWDALHTRLADKPKDTPIMTYCTGGIRCVKVGAYLTQEMGFTNVSRLAGGIIAYDRALQQQLKEEKSMFKGTNFVFDGRLGRPITEDAMGSCLTCGSITSFVSNCQNGNCHKRMIQCETCRTSFFGTCSSACRNRLLRGNRNVDSLAWGQSSAASVTTESRFASLEDYSTGLSTPPPSLYREVEFNTKTLIPSGGHMVSGEAQGRLLKQFASLTRNGRILELGTFTGYATMCLLEGLSDAVPLVGSEQHGSLQQGPYLMSMERDGKAFDLAAAHMKLVTRHGFGEDCAEALCALRSKEGLVPHVEQDVVTLSYNDNNNNNNNSVGCDLVHVSDALATLEEMAMGQGNWVPGVPFDLVFVDADKTRLYEYVDACLSSDILLNRGGYIMVDNVLWKGLVLGAADANFFSSTSEPDDDNDNEELKRNRRARKLAIGMHRFNRAIAADSRAEVLVLPVRDGLSIIRKK